MAKFDLKAFRASRTGGGSVVKKSKHDIEEVPGLEEAKFEVDGITVVPYIRRETEDDRRTPKLTDGVQKYVRETRAAEGFPAEYPWVSGLHMSGEVDGKRRSIMLRAEAIPLLAGLIRGLARAGYKAAGEGGAVTVKDLDGLTDAMCVNMLVSGDYTSDE